MDISKLDLILDTGAACTLTFYTDSRAGPIWLIMVKQVSLCTSLLMAYCKLSSYFTPKLNSATKKISVCQDWDCLFVCPQSRDWPGPDPVKYKHRVLHVTVRMGPGQVHAIIFIGGWVLCCVVLVLLKLNPFISAPWWRREVRPGMGEGCVVWAHTNTNKASPALRREPNTLQMCYSVTRPRDIQVREDPQIVTTPR